MSLKVMEVFFLLKRSPSSFSPLKKKKKKRSKTTLLPVLPNIERKMEVLWQKDKRDFLKLDCRKG